MLYHLTTEDKPNLEELTSSLFDGFTIRRGAIGYWQGQPEASATIEISHVGNIERIDTLIELIKSSNRQFTVMEQSWEDNVRFK